MIAGGATSMEQYKYLLGQAHAYQSLDNALTDILNEKENKDEPREDRDNVIQFGSPEDENGA